MAFRSGNCKLSSEPKLSTENTSKCSVSHTPWSRKEFSYSSHKPLHCLCGSGFTTSSPRSCCSPGAEACQPFSEPSVLNTRLVTSATQWHIGFLVCSACQPSAVGKETCTLSVQSKLQGCGPWFLSVCVTAR